LFSWILTAPFFRYFSHYSLYPPFLLNLSIWN